MNPFDLAAADPCFVRNAICVGWLPQQTLWHIHCTGILSPTDVAEATAFLLQAVPQRPLSRMLVDLHHLLHVPEGPHLLAALHIVPALMLHLRSVAYVLPEAPQLHSLVYAFRHSAGQFAPAQLFTCRFEAQAWLELQAN